jgi:hypothetical protein
MIQHSWTLTPSVFSTADMRGSVIRMAQRHGVRSIRDDLPLLDTVHAFESAFAPLFDDAVADERIAAHPLLHRLREIARVAQADGVSHGTVLPVRGDIVIVYHDPYDPPLLRARFPDAVLDRK